jgi:hypothetical protein
MVQFNVNKDRQEITSEEGELVFVTFHYITAVFPNGKRLIHVYSTLNKGITVDRLEDLAIYLNGVQPRLNENHWYPGFPVYGSEVWQQEERHHIEAELNQR